MSQAFFFTHNGGFRPANEDAVLVEDDCLQMDMESYEVRTIYPDSGFLSLVADGIGGRPAGALASRTVLEFLKKNLKNVAGCTPEEVLLIIQKGLDQASAELENLSQADTACKGLGTALAGLLVIDNKQALIFNCGDCRVYRYRKGYIKLLTQDHSVAYRLYMAGKITEEELVGHPKKHLLTASINGDARRGHIDFFHRLVPVQDGDIFFICSDGVWELIDVLKLEKNLLNHNIDRVIPQILSDLKNQFCPDNLSFIFLSITNEA